MPIEPANGIAGTSTQSRSSHSDDESAASAPYLAPEFLPRIGRHLAHELNNPISAISSAAFLIQDFIDTAEGGMLETELVKPFIESIREECNKMKTIVEEFAKFVTTESILPLPMNLEEFLRMRCTEMQNDGLPVEFRGSSMEQGILADAGQLQFVLRALTMYAVQSGATKVTVEASGNENCLITVKDDRPQDLSPEELHDVFNPLPAKRTPGLGLKLPLVKRVVDLHHGTLEMSSKTGEGVTICITLPLNQ